MANEKYIKETLKKIDQKLSRIEKLIESKSAIKQPAISATTKASKSKKGKGTKSVLQLIEQLRDDKFFDTPKTLKEINAKLREDKYYYNVTSLTNPLQRALRQGKLGRISVNGIWAYVKR